MSAAADPKYLRRRLWVAALIAVVSALTAVTIGLRLHLDPNVAGLLPERGESAALRQYLRAFGGSDLSVVLVTATLVGDEAGAADAAAHEVELVAQALEKQLGALATVRVAAAGMELDGQLDPWLVWRHADAAARARLARVLTPATMRRRLEASRDMLLAPGAGAAAERLARDPLRLWQLVMASRRVGSGFTTQADGSFATDDGLARLVLVFPRGEALRGADAKAFVRQARQVIAAQRAAHPAVSIGLTGGHAIAAATEHMLIGDLTLSGTLSMLLASLAFVLTFRRTRALWAVMPPLCLGTLWTAGIAASWPSGLSGIAVAFMSVVVGVGVDTGVHVYAALLEQRAAGLGPADAARVARQRTMQPVLIAAVTAGAAFASLGLSEIAALRQFGVLCAVGEVLTALAIVAVTPEIGAWLERRPSPRPRAPRWTAAVGWLTATPRRAIACLLITVAPVLALGAGYLPTLSEAIVAMRPAGLKPLAVQERMYELFGGRHGQWVVLVSDRDRQAAMARADRLVEALAATDDLDSLDALTTVVPALETQRRRLAARDALDLPAKADELERALGDTGFAPARFTGVLAAMRHPSHELVSVRALEGGDKSIMLSRYLGRDGEQQVVAIYVLPRHEPVRAGASNAERQRLEALHHQHEQRVEQLIVRTDAAAALTGYGRLERSLRAALAADLPRIGAVALALVVLALALSLRKLRDVVLAATVVVLELGIVLFLIRVLHIPLHAYDALVLPVLLGITVDEGMFLLFRAREAADAPSSADRVAEVLRLEGPPVAATALTTAAGFAGLLACDFDGLRDLGAVGAVGSVVGLLVALVVVPAGLRATDALAARRTAPA